MTDAFEHSSTAGLAYGSENIIDTTADFTIIIIYWFRCCRCEHRNRCTKDASCDHCERNDFHRPCNHGDACQNCKQLRAAQCYSWPEVMMVPISTSTA